MALLLTNKSVPKKSYSKISLLILFTECPTILIKSSRFFFIYRRKVYSVTSVALLVSTLDIPWSQPVNLLLLVWFLYDGIAVTNQKPVTMIQMWKSKGVVRNKDVITERKINSSKSSLPLVKVMIFQKMLNIVKIREADTYPAYFDNKFWYQN